MTAWLDKITDRWLDDPRSDVVTLVVGVSVYFLFWAVLAGVLLWLAACFMGELCRFYPHE
jgi:hypothetical protein